MSDLLASIVARDVSFGVEMARSLGFTMPKHFAVGLSLVTSNYERRGFRRCYRIRLDDVTAKSTILWPHDDGTVPMRIVDQLLREAFDRLHIDACTMANVWIDKHPEARAKAPTEALAKLSAASASDSEWERFAASARNAMYRSDFRRVR